MKPLWVVAKWTIVSGLMIGGAMVGSGSNAKAEELSGRSAIGSEVAQSEIAQSELTQSKAVTEQSTKIQHAPQPGTLSTSAAVLSTGTAQTSFNDAASGTTLAQNSTPAAPTIVAQEITPGTSTRSGPSYIGIGGNIGLADGTTDVGEGAFAILSKIGLTRSVSVRPAVLFGDDVTFLLPVTLDFPTQTSVGRFGIAPYIGAGVAIVTDSDDTFNGLLTAGVDVPINERLTATAAVNVTVFNDTDVGLLLGLGYNF